MGFPFCSTHSKGLSVEPTACRSSETELSPRSVAFALHTFAEQFAVAAHRFGPLARPPFRWLFVTTAEFHFPKYPFALHFFL
jgi:hypothetical protein